MQILADDTAAPPRFTAHALARYQEPFIGADSYQAHDAQLFFGREYEARQLISKILSRRFTLLHAPSAAGKTSLLNARVIPGLERRGWLPIRARPEDDPLASIRNNTLQYVLPPLQAERAALDAAEAALRDDPDETLTLGALLGRYQDRLPLYAPAKRALIAPYELMDEVDPVVFTRDTAVMPYFRRLLRGSISLVTFGEHLRALEQGLDSPPDDAPPLTPETPLDALRARLDAPALDENHRALLDFLTFQPPGEPLVLTDFFCNLCTLLAPRYSTFTLVLLLDQFEEIYARYTEAAARPPAVAALRRRRKKPPDWRLKYRLFDELAALYTRRFYLPTPHGTARRPTFLPLRLVISMRDEYIGRLLRDVRGFVDQLYETVYGLAYLSPEEAEAAIRQPAAIFRRPFSDASVETICQGLIRERHPSDDDAGHTGFVEPAPLQIVCEKLWNEAKRNDQQQIDRTTFGDLGRSVEAIFTTYIDDFLADELVLPGDLTASDPAAREAEANRQKAYRRLVVLAMLEPLITTAGTRNLVLRESLLDVPFGQEDRALLLERLEGRLLRRRQRFGEDFIEITHEFLITPILQHIEDELAPDDAYRGFRKALTTLADYEHRNFRVGTAHLLPVATFEHLHAFHDAVAWPPWVVELMLRSAIVHHAPPEVLRVWVEAFARLPVPTPRTLGRTLHADARTLCLEELRLLKSYRMHDELTPTQLAQVLRSVLCEADADARDEVIFWTKRYLDALQPPNP